MGIALNAASCAFHFAWSTSTQPVPDGVADGVPPPPAVNENQLMFTKSPPPGLRSTANTVCAPAVWCGAGRGQRRPRLPAAGRGDRELGEQRPGQRPGPQLDGAVADGGRRRGPRR